MPCRIQRGGCEHGTEQSDEYVCPLAVTGVSAEHEPANPIEKAGDDSEGNGDIPNAKSARQCDRGAAHSLVIGSFGQHPELAEIYVPG